MLVRSPPGGVCMSLLVRCFVLFVVSSSWIIGGPARAQQKPAPAAPEKTIAIRAGHLIDGKADKALDNVLIIVKGDTIVSVTSNGTPPSGAEVIDLSKATVLPGFIDTHTHVLLNGDITAEDYDKQLLKDSIPYRAILGARNARIALELFLPRAPCGVLSITASLPSAMLKLKARATRTLTSSGPSIAALFPARACRLPRVR